MTSEQLKAARAEKWRQTGNALLTQDEAQAWIKDMGLVLYLPRRTQLQVDAPSFVEAVIGQPNPTPGREALDQAYEMLLRLTTEGSAIPLNLMGTQGEQPDFLVSAELLPYIYALRGDRDWKRAPQVSGVRSVSPLVAHVYEALEKSGSETLFGLRDKLGSELTEAAVLRALTELWTEMRVLPVFHGNGEPTLWQPLRLHHSKAMAQGTSTSHLTAVSVLSSLWVQTAIAANADEVETFLSPLTSRSKIREVLNGLSATRQLESISAGHLTYFFVAGTLPEFPEVAPAEGAESPETSEFETGRARERSPRRPRTDDGGAGAERRPARSFERRPPTRDTRDREGADRRQSSGGFRERRSTGRSFERSERSERPAARRQDDSAPRERSGFRRSEEGRGGPRKFGNRVGQGDRPNKPWVKREGDREEGRGRRSSEEGGFRSPRRTKSWEAGGEERSERRPRTEGRSEESSFRRSRPERPAAGRGFEKRSEGRGPRNFERGGDRPPRREPRWKSDEERPRERKPRTEGRSEEGSFRKPRAERPTAGRGFEKRGESRGPRSFERGGDRPPRREPRWKSDEERPRERKPRTEGRSEEGSFRRSRPERPAAGRGFEKRSEGRGPRNFERGGDRPPRREFRPRSGEEGERKREDRPRREGGFSSRPSGSSRFEGREKRPGGFGAKGGKPKSGGKFGRKPSGGKFPSKPGGRPAKKFGRKDRPE